MNPIKIAELPYPIDSDTLTNTNVILDLSLLSARFLDKSPLAPLIKGGMGGF
jgi:hypothetical protein